MRQPRIRFCTALASVLIATAAFADGAFDAKTSLRDNLTALMTAKKSVVVNLTDGKSYQARIAAVGDELVVLTEPAQKEFFDVLIPIDEISSVEARVR